MSHSSAIVRLAEALATLSPATDVGNGLPLETSLREATVAARLADRADLAIGERTERLGTAAPAVAHRRPVPADRAEGRAVRWTRRV